MKIQDTKFVTFSRGIARASEIAALLEGSVHLVTPFSSNLTLRYTPSIAVGWGLKDNTKKIQTLAQKKGLPYWYLEDGFISYLGHPALGDGRFSLITDTSGIYYDATRPSDIEQLLNWPDWQTPEFVKRARKLLDKICQHKISKYNHELTDRCVTLTTSKSRILVVDQTFGDCSVKYGIADETSFKAMLQAALDENPDSEIWVKVHPDVVLGTKQGYFEPEADGVRLKGFSDSRIRVLAEKVNAQSLFPHFEKVYVVTSQLGFEALWHGKQVVCFGVPFYSGWGLTDDRVPCPRRKQQHTIESLFAAACLKYTRYIHPETGKRCELDDVLDLIILQRRYQQPQVKTLYALGFSLWKRAFVSTFARGLADNIVYIKNERALKKRLAEQDGVLIWGMKQAVLPVNRKNVPVWRMEDGFIRSCGLGADLRRPGSLVIDQQGIYYNATQPSDLETALNLYEMTDEEHNRGRKLTDLLLERRISKYNLAGQSTSVFENAQPGQLKVLVTGQVDSDASLKFGSPKVYRNIDLLASVREYFGRCPEGSDNLKSQGVYIVYKPHPDVVQAGRAGHVPEHEALKWADRVVTDVDIFDCIQQCDQLHVMSSQAGFEALLQQKSVHCWGMPFYAGWGLTTDHIQCERRQKKRSLDALVYLALCHYPRYINWKTGRFTSPEALIEQLSTERKTYKQSGGKITGWLAKKHRKLCFLLDALGWRS